MEHIGDILKNELDALSGVNNFNYRKPFVDPLLNEKTAITINALFAELQGIFPAFKQSWPTEYEFELAKKSWVKGFIDADLSDLSLIKLGLDKLRLDPSPFVPSIGAFINLCKPSNKELGLPDTQEAYKIACYNAKNYNTSKKPWKHDSVRYALQMTSGHVLNTRSEKESFAAFKNNYEGIIQDLLKAKKEGRPESDVLPDFSVRDEPQTKLEFMEVQRIEREREQQKINKEHEERNKKFLEERGPYKNWTPQQLMESITPEQKKNWKPGQVFPQYAHLDNAEDALPFLHNMVAVIEKKQANFRKLMNGVK